MKSKSTVFKVAVVSTAASLVIIVIPIMVLLAGCTSRTATNCYYYISSAAAHCVNVRDTNKGNVGAEPDPTCTNQCLDIAMKLCQRTEKQAGGTDVKQ